MGKGVEWEGCTICEEEDGVRGVDGRVTIRG